MISKYSALFLAALLISSCNLFKKNNTSDNTFNAINLDTLEVEANASEGEYQAAATRVNDIIHTKLDVSFNWERQYLYGKATITIKPYFYPTSTLELDARGMDIKEVSLVKEEYEKNGYDSKKDPQGNYEANVSKVTVKVPLNYTYENDVIKIKLDKEYKKTEEYTVFIDYVSKPNELKKGGGSAAITDDKGLYFINPLGKEKDKPQQIWTQGETQASSAWFPTIDRPNERMTNELCITVNKKYVTLSNGELLFSSDNGDSTRTDCWRMDLPHAPYLVMMAIGDFAVIKDRWHDKEVSYYLEKEYAPYSKEIFGNTPEMLEFFSTKLGVEYVWNKYSQVVVRDYVSGAMENTTATLHGEFLQRTDRELLDQNFEDVISHELFHQWFGDLVTCESWSNLPLNESFATYGEYLWKEYKYGADEADYLSEDSRQGYLDESGRKQVDLVRYHYNDKEDMFDAHSYNKGGQVLHMLRKYVGDEAFFASLKLYLETNKFTSVEIHNLRMTFEQVTGEDLNWFFNQWFLSSGHPVLVIKTPYDTINKKQKVQIIQTQDLKTTPLFRIPMYVDIYYNGKKDRHRIVVSKVDETFEFDAVHPDLVNVDAEKTLLCVKYEEKSVPELAFQFKNAPLYRDRSEALNLIAQYEEDSLAAEVLIAALNDPFWKIREDAIVKLKIAMGRYRKEAKELLVRIAKNDSKASVRATAIYFLSEEYKDPDLKPIYENALNDRAYSVMGAGLVAYAKTNPEEALKLAKKYEEEKNTDILFTIADLYANYGSDDNNKYFINVKDKFTGFSRIGYVSLYGLFLQRSNVRNETVISGVDILKTIAQSDAENKWVTYYTRKTIKELITMYEVRIADNTQKLKTLKSKTPNSPEIGDIEKQLASDKIQQQKISEMYSTIKASN
ncbi:MAG: M1 family metallopeptidase [Bacteroidia bacterium]